MKVTLSRIDSEDLVIFEGVVQIYQHNKKGIALKFADPAVPTALIGLPDYTTDTACFPGHEIVEVVP